jgi:lysophospholipase L1-like esterase
MNSYSRDILLIGLCLVLLPQVVNAQLLPQEDRALAAKYSFITPTQNIIQHARGLDSFFIKLHLLKDGNKQRVSIVHIGDSHIQADFFASVLRNELQNHFGDAGRGLVFPYQLAQTNGPDDIASSSGQQWQFNRLVHPEIAVGYGVSGYGIQPTVPTSEIKLQWKGIKPGFDRLLFFTDSMAEKWICKLDENDSIVLSRPGGIHLASLKTPVNSFSLLSPAVHGKSFYGVSLEKAAPGIIYHTIGVNGARYDHYNKADLFWKQLPALQADLFIVSLGTNEAQFATFSESQFAAAVDDFIRRLKLASPGTAVLITTAADSYKNRRYNSVLREINGSLAMYCRRNGIPFWDLYKATKGYGSASMWYGRRLMQADRIHFTPEGYKLQGKLLLAAISRTYNDRK